MWAFIKRVITIMISILKRIRTKFRNDSNLTLTPTPTPTQDESLSPKDLHVVAVYFNHHRYENLRLNFDRFRDHMQELGVTLHVVELQVGSMPFEVTEEGNIHHIRLRSDCELFHKENLVNIGVAQSVAKNYPDWKYVAWVDADVTFLNPNIALDTIHQLNRYSVVQMWSKAIDLGPDTEPLHFKVGKNESDAVVSSFAYCYREKKIANYQYTTATTWHPGYAWAMNRQTWDSIGGLLDISILGAGDHHMAWAFAGRAHQGIHGASSDDYKKQCLQYLYSAKHVVNSNLGYVKGTILHHWHGRKVQRKYIERWSISIDNNFEPSTDLVRRPDGLLELAGNKPQLRDDIRAYFEARNDDCNTLE